MTDLIFKLDKTSYNTTDSIKLTPNFPFSVLYATNAYFTLYKKLEDETFGFVDFIFIPELNSETNLISLTLQPNEPMEPNQVYSIVIRDIVGTSDSSLTSQLLNFYVLQGSTTRNVNDIYYQMENLGTLVSYEQLLTSGKYLNYQINPKSYNFETKKYASNLDANNELIILDVKNDEIIRDLIIDQFLYEYRHYFADINNYKDLPAATITVSPATTAAEQSAFNTAIVDLNNAVLAGDMDAYYQIEQFLLSLYNNAMSVFTSSYVTEDARIPVNISDEDLNKLNLLIMNNITKFNALKGTLSLIEIVLGIYIKMLGYQMISVIPDGEKNFVYRISCSLPLLLWRRTVRPIVHPCGWSDIYNYVDSIVDGVQIEVSRDRLDIFRMIRESWRLHTVSYLDAEYFAKLDNKTHYKLLKTFSHVNGNIEAQNVLAHNGVSGAGHEDCTFLNSLDQTEFNFNFAGNIAPLNYGVSGLDKELYSPFVQNRFMVAYSANPVPLANSIIAAYEAENKRIFTIDQSLGNNTFSMAFGKPGIALEYLWKVYKGNRLLDIFRTPFETLDIDFNSMPSSAGYVDDDHTYQVVLQLKHEGWSKEIFNFNASNMPFVRDIPSSWEIRNFRRKQIGTRNNFLLDSNQLNIKLESIETEYANVAICWNNITNYNFASGGEYVSGGPAVSGVVDCFHAEFDYDSTIFSDSTTAAAVGSKGTPFTEINAVYNPSSSGIRGIGCIFDKYIWDVYKNNVKVRSYETPINSATIYIPTADLSSCDIGLTVVVNETNYQLNNMLSF